MRIARYCCSALVLCCALAIAGCAHDSCGRCSGDGKCSEGACCSADMMMKCAGCGAEVKCTDMMMKCSKCGATMRCGDCMTKCEKCGKMHCDKSKMHCAKCGASMADASCLCSKCAMK